VTGVQTCALPISVEKLVHVVETVEPDAELVEKYEQRYQKFKKYYPALRGLF